MQLPCQKQLVLEPIGYVRTTLATKVEAAGQGIEGCVGEKALGSTFHERRVPDMAVTDDEGLFRRFDESMDVVETFVLDRAEAIIDPEQNQGCETLGRRRQVV